MESRYVGLRAAIRNAIASCLQTLPKPKKGKYEEPDYTAGIVTELPSLLDPWGKKWGLKFGGCFIHQSPRISYRDAAGVSKSCELGDLLVVCHDCIEDRYNAALLQLKMAGANGLTISPDEKQLFVYKNWPEITWKTKGNSYCIVPKTVTQGALYGVVHPQTGVNGVAGAKMTVSSAKDIIPTNGQSFEDCLYDVIDFRSGRTFTEPSKTMACDDWSKLINDLCDYMKDAVYNRQNIKQVKVARGVGGFFDFLREQDSTSLRDIARAQLNLDVNIVSDDAEEHGHLGILMIERSGETSVHD